MYGGCLASSNNPLTLSRVRERDCVFAYDTGPGIYIHIIIYIVVRTNNWMLWWRVSIGQCVFNFQSETISR
jgi:hypothetical protein